MNSHKERLIIGFDLDGVIAQPLFDGFLVKARILKEHLLKLLGRESDYYYPKSKIERLTWTYLNRLRKPTLDRRHLENLKNSGNFSFLLITSRLKFLECDTRNWLEKYHLDEVFDKIEINESDLNPIDFKAQVLSRETVGFYLDDDLEILVGLRNRVETSLYWLGNQPLIGRKIKTAVSIGEFLQQVRG